MANLHFFYMQTIREIGEKTKSQVWMFVETQQDLKVVQLQPFGDRRETTVKWGNGRGERNSCRFTPAPADSTDYWICSTYSVSQSMLTFLLNKHVVVQQAPVAADSSRPPAYVI